MDIILPTLIIDMIYFINSLMTNDFVNQFIFCPTVM